MWPPDELWSRIAAMWHHAYGPPSGEQGNALVALRQLQSDFGLSDAQVAYIAEYQTLDPSSRVIRRERPENAFEVVLGVLDEVGLVMPFEHFVLDTAWVLHTYVFHQFLHTPRWLIWSRGSGYGSRRVSVASGNWRTMPGTRSPRARLCCTTTSGRIREPHSCSTIWRMRTCGISVVCCAKSLMLDNGRALRFRASSTTRSFGSRRSRRSLWGLSSLVIACTNSRRKS